MKFLDGWKTAIGAGGLILTTIVPKWAPAIGDAVPVLVDLGANISGAVALIGILHKIIKGRR